MEEILKKGGIGVIPTDTLYGVVGKAILPDVVERIYKLRRRAPTKPFIILISSLFDLKKFNIKFHPETKQFLESNWPNPISVILPCPDEKFEYLHRGTKTLAFRMPNDQKLLKLIKDTGPLVAPSANFEGSKPAETIKEAKAYFGDEVDLYMDGGKLSGKASTLVYFKKGQLVTLRQGDFYPIITNP